MRTAKLELSKNQNVPPGQKADILLFVLLPAGDRVKITGTFLALKVAESSDLEIPEREPGGACIREQEHAAFESHLPGGTAALAL